MDAYQHLVTDIKNDLSLKLSNAVAEALGDTPLPVITAERFSELTGIEIGVLKGWIQKDHIPTIKIGKRRLINLAALHAMCLESRPY